MKVTFVSDNRTSSNWGCRATSLALSEIISTRFSIHNTIYRDDKFKIVRTGSIFPSFVEQRIYHGNLRNPIKRIFRKLDSFYNCDDYVGFSPLESAKNLLSLKGNSEILEEIYQKICNSEIIIINGEGDLIFNPNRRSVLFLLMLIELASLERIPVFFVNAMISECPQFGRDERMVNAAIESLSKCSGISLRDPESVSLLHELAPHLRCTYIPDALFSWTRYCSSENLMNIKYGSSIIPFPRDALFGKYDFSEPYICLGGSSLAVKNVDLAIVAYTQLAQRLTTLGYLVYIVDTGDGYFLEEVAKITSLPLIPIETPILLGASILAKSSLFVSGRYHPSIMASLGGTPCIFLESNSHKTRSLQKVLDYKSAIEYSAIPTNEDIEEIVDRARDILQSGEEKRQKIQDQALFLSKESQKIIPFIEGLLLVKKA